MSIIGPFFEVDAEFRYGYRTSIPGRQLYSPELMIGIASYESHLWC